MPSPTTRCRGSNYGETMKMMIMMKIMMMMTMTATMVMMKSMMRKDGRIISNFTVSLN